MSVHPSVSGVRRSTELAATVSLALLSLATILQLSHVIVGTKWFASLAILCIWLHLVAYFCRQFRISTVVTFLIMAVFAIELISLLQYRSYLYFGFPTSEAFSVAKQDVVNGFQVIADYEPPVTYAPGFFVLIGLLATVMIFIGDWMAFRRKLLLEAILLPFGFFCFVSVLGNGDHSLTASALFIFSLLVFSSLQLSSLRALSVSPRSANRAKLSYARSGVITGIVGVLIAFALLPVLPGYDAKPILQIDPDALSEVGSTPQSPKGDTPSQVNQTNVDPSVNIEPSRIKNATGEVFTVKGPSPSYWRQQTLRFDGSWKPEDLDPGPSPSASAGKTYEFTVKGATQLAFVPSGSVHMETAHSYVHDVKTNQVKFIPQLKSGDSYSVVRMGPAPTAQQLRQASTGDGDDFQNLDLATYMSTDATDSVRERANQIAVNQTTPYDKAIALQNYFQSNYTYDIEQNAYPLSDPQKVEAFVLQGKSGFCQQFAVAFADMAQSLGLPTRIAVGYTSGVLKSDGLFHVQGIYAHAWPEVFFSNFGWVPFEPTPGRGNPASAGYTGIPGQQASQADPNTSVTIPKKSTPPTTTKPKNKPSTTPTSTAIETPAGHADRTWLIIFGIVLLAAIALVSILYWLRRRRCESSGWDQAEAITTLVSRSRRTGETFIQYASSVGHHMSPQASAELHKIASTCTRNEFSRRNRNESVDLGPLKQEVYDQIGKTRRFVYESTGIVISQRTRHQ